MSNFSDPLSPSPEFQASLDSALTTLHEAKIQTLASQGKTTQFIKAKLDKYRELWWDTIAEDLESDDKHIRRSAQIEYNKLQCRVLPTELTSPEDGGLVVKIMNYKQIADNNNLIAESSVEEQDDSNNAPSDLGDDL